MADGFESDRTEAYFSGRLRPHALPKRIKPVKKSDKDNGSESRAPYED